jgi:hypothetical protein
VLFSRNLSATPILTPVTIQLRGADQAQFAGFHAADLENPADMEEVYTRQLLWEINEQ